MGGRSRSGASVSENKIFVKVVEARRLPITGSASLYCSILCGSSLQKTRKVNAESSPMWSEEFHFDWKGGSGVEGLVIDIMEAKVIRDEIVGSIYIPLTFLPANKYTKEWRSIDTSESKFSSAQNAELLVEAIHIMTGAEGDLEGDEDTEEEPFRAMEASGDELDDEEDDDEGIKPRSTSSSPVRSVEDLDPERLTLEDVLQRSEAMVEFMQYLDSVGGTDYVQMYVMIDSYRQFARMEEADLPGTLGAEGAGRAMREDAMA
ncbi:hypothetical protein HDV00_001670, partial [Rhizophlyctis rosea]